jgi:hypothetical protein
VIISWMGYRYGTVVSGVVDIPRVTMRPLDMMWLGGVVGIDDPCSIRIEWKGRPRGRTMVKYIYSTSYVNTYHSYHSHFFSTSYTGIPWICIISVYHRLLVFRVELQGHPWYPQQYSHHPPSHHPPSTMAVATIIDQDQVAELQQQGDFAIKSSSVTPQLGGCRRDMEKGKKKHGSCNRVLC